MLFLMVVGAATIGAVIGWIIGWLLSKLTMWIQYQIQIRRIAREFDAAAQAV